LRLRKRNLRYYMKVWCKKRHKLHQNVINFNVSFNLLVISHDLFPHIFRSSVLHNTSTLSCRACPCPCRPSSSYTLACHCIGIGKCEIFAALNFREWSLLAKFAKFYCTRIFHVLQYVACTDYLFRKTMGCFKCLIISLVFCIL
jgi:hypothetical protein